jgi:hypothetical protein
MSPLDAAGEMQHYFYLGTDLGTDQSVDLGTDGHYDKEGVEGGEGVAAAGAGGRGGVKEEVKDGVKEEERDAIIDKLRAQLIASGHVPVV